MMDKKIPAAGLLAALAIALAACSGTTPAQPSAASSAATSKTHTLADQKQLRAVRVSQESQAG
jgi:hypothetical protein